MSFWKQTNLWLTLEGDVFLKISLWWGSIKSQNIIGVTLWCQLSHKISLGSHGGVNFVTKYIVIVLVVYLEGISNITAVGPVQWL